MDPTHQWADLSPDLAYRVKLLCISDQLASQDIQKLLWLLKKIIPLSVAEKVCQGCQLFEVLEQLDLLSANNLKNLHTYLTAIGRQDLAKVLPVENHSCLAVAISTTSGLDLPASPPDFAYRRELLHISDRLRLEDLRNLLWLLKKIIPQAKAERITEGYQLFDELEKRGFLSPTSIKFLCTHLLVTNRADLSQSIAQQVALPYIPSTFTTCQHTHVYRAKTEECVWKIKALGNTGTALEGDAWERLKKMSNNFIHEVTFGMELDIPENWWQPTGTAAQVDEVVENTLQYAFSFAKAQLGYMHGPLPFEADQIWLFLKDCHHHYKQFDKELGKVHWNTNVRQKIRENVNKRKHPYGSLADHACEYIHTVGKVLLQDEHFETEVDRVKDNLYTLESIWYTCWQMGAMLHWLSNLLHLGQSSVIDLSRYRTVLRKIYAEHKDDIEQNSETLSYFLGIDTMQNLCPDFECKSQRNSCKFLTTCVPVLWHMLLMELIAIAEGNNKINPREIGTATAQRLINENIPFKCTVKLHQCAAHRMHLEVMKLWKHATRIASCKQCNTSVIELFPDLECV